MTAGEPLIRVAGLHKTYRLGRIEVPVLRGVDLDVRAGEWLAVLGASGSGKSTLLHLLGGLDRPDRPQRSERGGGRSAEIPPIVFQGRALRDMGAAELDRFRAQQVGFVFQFYHLLPELTVLENVLVGAMVRHGRWGYRAQRDGIRTRAEELLQTFGLGHRLRHRPAELSGGERQRTAIARALINRPTVLLADEPTGNLDRSTGQKILDAITHVRAQLGQTIVMVTHDAQIAARADRQIRLEDGLVVPGSPAAVVAVPQTQPA